MLIDDFAAFEEDEVRDGANAVFGGELLLGVDVDFADLDGVAFFFGEFVEDGSEHFAGTAPFRPEVDEDGDVGGFYFGFEVIAGEFENGFVSHGRLVKRNWPRTSGWRPAVELLDLQTSLIPRAGGSAAEEGPDFDGKERE